MAITRAGVYYDLEKSHHRCKVRDVVFVFSSQLHLDKFIAQREEHRKKINDSLTKRFNMLVDVSLLADVVLYRRIETRGFLIVCKEGYITCANSITCDGLKVTPQN